VRTAPLLLVNLTTEEGITGRTYLFCYRTSVPRAIDVLLRDAVSLVAGERANPIETSTRLNRRFALVGVSSIVRMALSALDTAMWDAIAVAAGLPLSTCSAEASGRSPLTTRAASVSCHPRRPPTRPRSC
jgi:mandelate racemase